MNEVLHRKQEKLSRLTTWILQATKQFFLNNVYSHNNNSVACLHYFLTTIY